MQALHSLYTPRLPLEDDRLFENYRSELSHIENDLQRAGAAFALIGGPGMAKSSILKRIRRDLLQQRSDSHLQSELVPIYIKLKAPVQSDDRLRLRALLKLIMEVIVDELLLGIGDLRLDRSSLRISRAAVSNSTDEAHDDFFNDLWQLVMEVERLVGPCKFVLLIDELDVLAKDESLRVLLARFFLDFVDGTNSKKAPRSYAAIVLACDRDLPEVLPIQQGKPLGAFVQCKYLSTLDRDSSFRLIQEPLLAVAGITLDPEVMEEVHVQTGGHPCLIHSVMANLCGYEDLQALNRKAVVDSVPRVADSLTDIAVAIQSYVDEDPLADLVFAVIYEAKAPLLLEEVVKALPAAFHGSRAFPVVRTLRMLAALGVVRIITDDRFTRYEGTGEIFRAWFSLPAKIGERPIDDVFPAENSSLAMSDEVRAVETVTVQKRTKFINRQDDKPPIIKVNGRLKPSAIRGQIFISYSHEDPKWLKKLKSHLKPLARKENISVWDDTMIKPGSKWEQEISNALADSKVAVLLVTSNFQDSDFITKQELPMIFHAAEKDDLRILWVAVSACTYEAIYVDEYQCLNDPARPLERMSRSLNAELARMSRLIIDYFR